MTPHAINGPDFGVKTQTPPYSALLGNLAVVLKGVAGKFVIVGIKDGAKTEIRHVFNGPNFVTEATAHFAALEAVNFNVYFHPGLMRVDLEDGRKGGVDDVIALAMLWCDFDGGNWTVAEVEKRCPSEQLYVSHLSETSAGNFQTLWHLDKPCKPADGAPLLAALVTATGADPAVKNVDRVLRAPGTMNHPSSAKVEKYRKLGITRVPEMCKVLVAAEDWEWSCGMSLGGFKTALLEKYPGAFDVPGPRKPSPATGEPVCIECVRELAEWATRDKNMPRAEWLKFIAGIGATPGPSREELLEVVYENTAAAYHDDAKTLFEDLPPNGAGERSIHFGTLVYMARKAGWTGTLLTHFPPCIATANLVFMRSTHSGGGSVYCADGPRKARIYGC